LAPPIITDLAHFFDVQSFNFILNMYTVSVLCYVMVMNASSLCDSDVYVNVIFLSAAADIVQTGFVVPACTLSQKIWAGIMATADAVCSARPGAG
jgi:hypothetical protein